MIFIGRHNVDDADVNKERFSFLKDAAEGWGTPVSSTIDNIFWET